jgi:phosphoribosylamine-glycine ligase
VIVCETREQSATAVARCSSTTLRRRRAHGARRGVHGGEELSLFAVTDGERAIPLLPAQDHKRLLDEDRGPNTGGMGAYAPVWRGEPPNDAVHVVMERIIDPTLRAMRAAGAPFTGLLYAGVMLTDDGPRSSNSTADSVIRRRKRCCPPCTARPRSPS